MKPVLTCRYLGTMLTNGGSSLALLFSSDHVVYLTTPPASAAPSNFSSLPSLKQDGRSQIICGLVSHFKVKQQLSSQLSHSGISRPSAREVEIEHNLDGSGLYLLTYLPVMVISRNTLVIHLPAIALLVP